MSYRPGDLVKIVCYESSTHQRGDLILILGLHGPRDRQYAVINKRTSRHHGYIKTWVDNPDNAIGVGWDFLYDPFILDDFETDPW